jgi:hypothetical protein
MGIDVKKTVDPLISSNGNVYSLSGIKRLLSAIFPGHVDKAEHWWSKSMRRSDHHDSKQQSKFKGK